MANQYYSLDKFDSVISHLDFRGWTRCASIDECRFIFTNLIKVDFKKLRDDVIVNHFHGSQHLSNKSFLAYHMYTAGYHYLMPVQWSVSYQNITKLISILLLNSVYSSCLNLLKHIKQSSLSDNHSESSTERNLSDEIVACKKIFRILHGYNAIDVTIRDDIELIAKLLAIFPDNDCFKVDINVLQVEFDNLVVKQPWRTSSGDKDIWIIKPVGLSCGQNIKVVSGIHDLLLIACEMNYKCVVQKYIERPLLVRTNRKFDIRQWILVTSVNPICIHGFSECYLRLSSQEYSLDKSQLADAKIHLCNHAIQKGDKIPASDLKSGDGSNESFGDIYCDTMMTQKQFQTELLCKQSNLDVDDVSIDPFYGIIQPRIKEIAVALVKSVREKLFNSGSGFEWLGLDLMVTENDYNVLLIEVNVSPDISHSTPVTSRLVDAAVEDLLRIVVDKKDERCLNGSTDQSIPTWHEWYKGDEEAFTSLRNFSKSKKDKEVLRTDYLPVNEQIVKDVLNSKYLVVDNDNDDNDDDDEC